MEINYNDEDIVDHHGVVAVIKNKKGEVLMQEHVKYNFWTIPVGKVKLGQEIEDALKEEIFEECNLVISKFVEIADKDYLYIRKGREVKVIIHLFEITEYSGIMKNKEPHKHRKQEFLSIEDIRKIPYLSDVTLLYLDTLGIKREKRI